MEKEHSALLDSQNQIYSSEKTGVKKKAGKIAAKTLEYYLHTLPLQGRTGRFLESKLEDYDASEMERISKNHPLFFGNIKPVISNLKKADVLGAYEAFWSEWNPAPNVVTKTVYHELGGNKRPVVASFGSFLYSGIFLHSFHPYTTPMYGLSIATGQYEVVPEAAGLITGVYVAFGIPVMIKKGWRNYKESRKKKQKDQL